MMGASGNTSEINVNWETFDYHNAEKQSKAFEMMCRLIFSKYYAENKILHSNPNNPGVEVEPVYVEKTKEWVSFQAKYNKKEIDLSAVNKSMDQAIKHYRGKLDRIYLFSNNGISTDGQYYKMIENKLAEAGIKLQLQTDEDILATVRNEDRIKEQFFKVGGYFSPDFRDEVKGYIPPIEAGYQYREKVAETLIEKVKQKDLLWISAEPGAGKTSFAYELGRKLEKTTFKDQRKTSVIYINYDKTMKYSLASLSTKASAKNLDDTVNKTDIDMLCNNVLDTIRIRSIMYNVIVIIDNFDVHMTTLPARTIDAMYDESVLTLLRSFDLKTIIFSRAKKTGVKAVELTKLKETQCFNLLKTIIGSDSDLKREKSSLKEIVRLTDRNPMLLEMIGRLMKINLLVGNLEDISKKVIEILWDSNSHGLEQKINYRNFEETEMTKIVREFIGMMNLDKRAMDLIRLLSAAGPEFPVSSELLLRLASKVGGSETGVSSLNYLVNECGLVDRVVYSDEQHEENSTVNNVKTHRIVTLAVLGETNDDFFVNAASECVSLLCCEYNQSPKKQPQALRYLQALPDDKVKKHVDKKLRVIKDQYSSRIEDLSVLRIASIVAGAFGFFDTLKLVDRKIVKVIKENEDALKSGDEPKRLAELASSYKAMGVTAGRYGSHNAVELLKRAIRIAEQLDGDVFDNVKLYMECRSTYLWAMLKNDEYSKLITEANSLLTQIEQGYVKNMSMDVLGSDLIEFRKNMIRDNRAMAYGKQGWYPEAVEEMSHVLDYTNQKQKTNWLRQIQVERALAYFYIGWDRLDDAQTHLNNCESKMRENIYHLSTEKAKIDEANILIGNAEIKALRGMKAKTELEDALRRENDQWKQINQVYYAEDIGKKVIVRKDTSIPFAQIIISPEKISNLMNGSESQIETIGELLENVKTAFILNKSELRENEVKQYIPDHIRVVNIRS